MNLNNKHTISVIIPAYKQEKTIEKDLLRTKHVMDQLRYPYEIIVVVDGKLDRTYENAKKVRSSQIHVIGYEINFGKAHAIRYGMQRAKGDIVGFMDSGMEIDPNGISMLLEHMEWYNADIIVGSKRHLASQVYYPFPRKVLSYGYYFLVKILFGIKVHDTQAGIKIFKREVLKAILPRLVEKKFAGDLEMLIVAKYLGFDKIYEAPIKLDYSLGGITSAATLQSVYGILIDTLAIFYRKNITHYYAKSHKNKLNLKEK